MTRLSLCLLFVLSSLPLLAQKQGRELIDSLLIEAPYVADTLKVRIYSTLSQVYTHVDPDSSIMFGEKGMAVAKRMNWNKGIALVANNMGSSYLNRSDNATALKYYYEALKVNKEAGDEQSVAMNLGNIGNVFYNQKIYDKAFDYYGQALKLNEKHGMKEKMATNLGNMANVFMHYFDTAKAGSRQKLINKHKTLDYFARSIALYQELGNKSGIARNKGNMGNIYQFDEDKTAALRYYNEALELNKDVGSRLFELAMKINIAMVYLDVAADTTGKLIIEGYTARNKDILADKAITMAEQAVKGSKEIGFLELLSEGLPTLSLLYAMKGNYKKAYENQVEFRELSDSLHKKSSEEAITKLEAKNKLDQQQKEIEIQKLAIAKKRNTTWFMGIGIVALLFVIGFVIKERKKSENLLLNILPRKIADRLKAKEHPIADQFTGASIMFIDIAGFTNIASDHEPKEIVSMLNDIFTMFDKVAEKHGLEKIKTIGDSYMAVAGVPLARQDHALAAANMALEVKDLVRDYKTKNGISIHFRIGLDCGPVVAGVIGTKKFTYDLWGDAVNMASRMESTGVTGEVHCSTHFKSEILGHHAYMMYQFAERGSIEIKGKGRMQTWLLSRKVKDPVLVAS